MALPLFRIVESPLILIILLLLNAFAVDEANVVPLNKVMGPLPNTLFVVPPAISVPLSTITPPVQAAAFVTVKNNVPAPVFLIGMELEIEVDNNAEFPLPPAP